MSLLKRKLGRLRVGDLLIVLYLILLIAALFIPTLRSSSGSDLNTDDFYTDLWPPMTP